MVRVFENYNILVHEMNRGKRFSHNFKGGKTRKVLGNFFNKKLSDKPFWFGQCED